MKNLVMRPDDTIILENVVLSFPHLFEPYGRNPTDNKKFSGKFMLSKKTHAEEIRFLQQHIQKLSMDKWKAKIGASNCFLKNGEDSGRDAEAPYFLVAASEKTRPVVVDADRTPLDVGDTDLKMYAGAIVNVQIKPWMQDNQFGKKVNANLLSVQFVSDGDRLVSSRALDPTDVYDDVSSFDDAASGFDGFDDDIAFQ